MKRSRAGLYSPDWRDRVRDGAVSSAKVIAELLVWRYNPRRVLDVGCGEGHFRDAFRKLGREAFGIDGEWVEGPDRTVDLARDDLAVLVSELGMQSLVVCLEVGEHLPEDRAEPLVEFLTSLAPTVAFSAAIPGQGGVGHENEQWPSWWATLFRNRGYGTVDDLRPILWNDDRVESWYRQNLLVYRAENVSPLGDPVLDLVHPEIWNLRR